MTSTMRNLRKAVVSLLTFAAAGVTWLAVGAAPSSAAGPTLDQVMQAGWSCRQTGDPTRTVCGQPGHGLPPRPGTPGFADRAPSYELLIFRTATGELLGFVKQLRPDIYADGTPPCPQQPSGEYIYEPFLDLWVCIHPK
jgi:hypothetical protein